MVLYVGDYDAASWVYQRVIDIWDHPDRGRVPLMWCISPVLERRVPMAMHYMRSTATANDYFAAADNGAGYLNPGMLQEPRGVSGLPGGLDAKEQRQGEHCPTQAGQRCPHAQPVGQSAYQGRQESRAEGGKLGFG